MPSFNVKVTQVYRVERSIVITRVADSIEEAVELQSEIEAPDYDDPGWREERTLENEEVEEL